MRLLILIPVVLIFISGCTTQPIAPAGVGLVIINFEPDFTEVFSTERVDFIARIKNNGVIPAEFITTEIVGIEDWKFLLHKQPECATGFGLVESSGFAGTEGETKTCTWTYEAPRVPEGLSVTYTPVLRAYYDYTSTTISSVSIVPRNELRRLQDTGQQLPITVTGSTGGPVSIGLSTEPIISFEDTVVFPLKITITNADKGVACYKPSCEQYFNQDRVKLSFDMDPHLHLLDCSEMEISLYKGQSNSVTCKVEAIDIPINSIVKRPITVTAEYEYLIEKSTQIVVKHSPN
ncbi:MAG: hypothetical protein ABIH52_04440 [Candidatus Aenigmatarchaeota archaeon]